MKPNLKLVTYEHLANVKRFWLIDKVDVWLYVLLVLLRWTPVCWAASECWTLLLSFAASKRTRFLRSSRPPQAPRTTWSLPVSSGPLTAMSSWWPMMARSIASWSKSKLYLLLTDLGLVGGFYFEADSRKLHSGFIWWLFWYLQFRWYFRGQVLELRDLKYDQN